MTTGLSSLLWFVAILALIPATLWLVKRTPLGGSGGAGVMKSIATLPLSTSQRIVTVEVGSGDERRWLVLGITPSSITTLHSMAPQAIDGGAAGVAGVAATNGAIHPGFAQILGRFRRAGGEGSTDAR